MKRYKTLVAGKRDSMYILEVSSSTQNNYIDCISAFDLRLSFVHIAPALAANGTHVEHIQLVEVMIRRHEPRADFVFVLDGNSAPPRL